MTPSARIAAILQPAIDAAAEQKQRPLHATITARLPYADFTQSPVGDLEADWMRAIVPGADASLTNSAGLRAPLEEGPLTYGGLHALLPFDNQRVTITLTGAQLRTVIAENLKRQGSMVVFSGLRAAAACEKGTVTVALRRESGQAIGDGERLKIVTSDFIATGGDSILTPVMPVQILETGATLRDEIAGVIERSGGRWGAEVRDRAPRVVVAGTRPLACTAG